MTRPIDISRECVTFKYKKNRYFIKTILEEDSLLTPYARLLMSKDKGYSFATTTNQYGDKIRTYEFDNVNCSYNDKTIMIPISLKGCANTEKIRTRMLNIMFGKSDGDLDSILVEGIKKWVPSKHSRGSNMIYKSHESLVSFGFEDLSEHSNKNNSFIVFDKKTGEEIKVEDLIKDKKGFMEYVNSHNYYLDGFLIDTTKM